MEQTEQKYCVVATFRATKKRGDITGALSLSEAQRRAQDYQTYQNRKLYVYPKVAKFPYKKK